MGSHRWIFAGLTTAGTLAAVVVALLALAPRPAWLNFTPAPGPAANALTLRADGPNVELLDTATGVVLQSRPLAAISGVSIHGLPGQVDDKLTVDLGGGPLALPGGILFDGGAGGCVRNHTRPTISAAPSPMTANIGAREGGASAPSPRRHHMTKPFTAVDLFAGAGGWTTGATQAAFSQCGGSLQNQCFAYCGSR